MSASFLEGIAILVADDDYHLAQETCTLLTLLGVEICGPVSCEDEARGLLATGRRVDGALLKLDLKDGSTAALARTFDRDGIPFACVGTATPQYCGVPVATGSMTPYAAVSALLRSIEARQPLAAA